MVAPTIDLLGMYAALFVLMSESDDPRVRGRAAEMEVDYQLARRASVPTSEALLQALEECDGAYGDGSTDGYAGPNFRPIAVPDHCRSARDQLLAALGIRL